MSDNLKSQIIEALKDQKNIFGDELYEPASTRRKTIIQKTGNSNNKNKEIKEIMVEKVKPEGEDKENGLFIKQKEKWEKAKSLDTLNKLICECQKCPLGATRNKFVFGSGNPDADVMVVGEGPGADEDAQGLPFIGRAGKLLTDILKAIHFERDEVYIANIVKCRPPGNRTPLQSEMDTCLPYLKKQIDLIKPKLILCLGLTAAQGLLKKRESLTKMRGIVFEVENVKTMVTYHPAALLRNPNWKRPCWQDVQQFRKLYDDMNK